ncbi:MAG: hypothetical protein QM754_12815 [Tepidisphaeraceae bacterium]
MSCSERVAGWFLIGIVISALIVLVMAVAQESGMPTVNAPPSLMGIALTIALTVIWTLFRLLVPSLPVPHVFYTRQGRPHDLFTPLYDQR